MKEPQPQMQQQQQTAPSARKPVQRTRGSRCLSSALTLTPPRPRIGAYPVGEAVAHAVEVVRRNRRPLGHGAVRGGGRHAVAVADDRPLVLRHVVDRELQRDGAEGTEEK